MRTFRFGTGKRIPATFFLSRQLRRMQTIHFAAVLNETNMYPLHFLMSTPPYRYVPGVTTNGLMYARYRLI